VAEQEKGRHRLLLWGAIAVGVLIIVALVLPGISLSQPGYYRRYPALAKRMDNWATSTHSRMSCVQCHVEPGVKGALEFGIKAVPAFYSQLFGGPSTTNLLKPPTRAACQKCHTSYRKVAPSGDLLIPHKAHVEVLDMQCGQCHKDLVHSLNRRGFNRPEMEGCLEQCHDGDKASDECVSCHTRKEVPKSHKQAGWLETHGQEAKKQDCGECHDWTPNYCSACHKKRPPTHTATWKTDHGAKAKVRDDGCMVCHDKKFCEQCH
jgi:hypothetical protein